MDSQILADYCQWTARSVPLPQTHYNNGMLEMTARGSQKGYQRYLKKDYIQEHEEVIVYPCYTRIITDNPTLRMLDPFKLVSHHRTPAMEPDAVMGMPPYIVLMLTIGIKIARVLQPMLQTINHSRYLMKCCSSAILVPTMFGFRFQSLHHQIHLA